MRADTESIQVRLKFRAGAVAAAQLYGTHGTAARELLPRRLRCKLAAPTPLQDPNPEGLYEMSHMNHSKCSYILKSSK